MRGNLYIVSGPSGVGKGTICEEIVKKRDVFLSISATSREPRPYETDGVHYYFKSKSEMERMIENGELLEWNCYNGNFYGTPISVINEKIESGIDVILEIDVNGGLKVKEKINDAILVFILPPSEDELKNRLKGRGSETEEQIQNRIAIASGELEKAKIYDYTIVNDELDKCVDKLCEFMEENRKKGVIEQ